MKYNTSHKGFASIILAIIAALSLGGAVAYKANRLHKESVQEKVAEIEKIKSENTNKQEGTALKTESEKPKPTSTYTNTATKTTKYTSKYESESEDEDEGDDDNEGGYTTQPKTTTPATPTPTPTATYTLADVKLHATRTNCWTTVNGKVYDVTPFITQHPGGANAIISLCGIDGSPAFNGQHGGQARPASELASFIIGTLK